MSQIIGSETVPEPRGWLRQPFVPATIGSVLLLVAQPPLSLAPLAWAAPLPWLYLATRPQLGARRPNLQLWAAGFLYWVLAAHWLRLAHPATFLGLLALAAYFGVYLPIFVQVVRHGVKRWALPVWLVAPVVWVAIEWLQAHLLGGFLMAALGHTQIEYSPLVQIADLGGAYLVSALVILVAGCVCEIAMAAVSHLGVVSRSRAVLAALVGVVAVSSSLHYGRNQLANYAPAPDAETKRLALIQGNERAVWTSDPGRDKRVMDVYVRLTDEATTTAAQQRRPLDLVVWPEGAFRTPMFEYGESTEFTDQMLQNEGVAERDLSSFVKITQAPVLVGIDRLYFADPNAFGKVFNAAVAIDADGAIVGTYDKNHLVMFGEYVPGGSIWPGIYRYFPIGGVTPGGEAALFAIDGVKYMPTICYETVIPHVIRRQVVELTDAGERPDVLVNITNDSWFYDSSELAMHLACSRFRAIECRTPMVVAANGGLSANIDRCGRVLDVSQPMTEEVLLVDVVPGGSDTPYLRYGDTFAIACLVVSVLLAADGLLRRWQS